MSVFNKKERKRKRERKGRKEERREGRKRERDPRLCPSLKIFYLEIRGRRKRRINRN